jgi:hypothetical protein
MLSAAGETLGRSGEGVLEACRGNWAREGGFAVLTQRSRTSVNREGAKLAFQRVLKDRWLSFIGCMYVHGLSLLVNLAFPHIKYVTTMFRG